LDLGSLQTQGAIATKTRDTFNIRLYYHSMEEVKALLIKCGAFDIQYVQLVDDESLCLEDQRMCMLQVPQSFAKFYSTWVMSMSGSIMEAHMGLQTTDEFFICHQRHIVVHAISFLFDTKAQQEYKCFNLTLLLVVLKHK